MIKADEVREWARAALDSEKAYDVSEVGQPYYTINGRDVSVVRSWCGCLFGANSSFDRLEDGSVIFWFAGDAYNLRNEAGKAAQRLEKWRKYCAWLADFSRW